jgi:hypothetical protein
MVNLREIVISLISGMLIGGGWWAFFDGVVYAPDSFPWIHILPPLAATVAFVCINLATLEDLQQKTIVKVWMFVWLTVACIAVGGGIWITAVEYPADIASNWPGVAIIVHAVLVLFAALLFFIGRSSLLVGKGMSY